MHPKRLTNKSEKQAFETVKKGLPGNQFQLNKKVAVKDVIDAQKQEISQLPEPRRRIYWTGHFDFVCTSEPDDKVEFILEYDGAGHSDPTSEMRDRAKNSLCRDAEIPILRISHDNMLREFEKTSVAEYMASLFVSWKKARAEYVGRKDGYLDFLLDNPFPPRTQAFTRVHQVLTPRMGQIPNTTTEFMTYPGFMDFASDPIRLEHFGVVYERPSGNCKISFHGDSVVGEGVRRLYHTKRTLTFSWKLPVDDEAYERIGAWQIPTHHLAFSELPGASPPSVMEEVLEYLVLRDIEEWVNGKAGKA